MPHPTQRHTKSRRDKRRAGLRLSAAPFTKCPKCGHTVQMHRMCQWCGTYRDREVVDVLAKLDKKERKKKEKELKAAEKEQQRDRPQQSLEQLSQKI